MRVLGVAERRADLVAVHVRQDAVVVSFRAGAAVKAAAAERQERRKQDREKAALHRTTSTSVRPRTRPSGPIPPERAAALIRLSEAADPVRVVPLVATAMTTSVPAARKNSASIPRSAGASGCRPQTSIVWSATSGARATGNTRAGLADAVDDLAAVMPTSTRTRCPPPCSSELQPMTRSRPNPSTRISHRNCTRHGRNASKWSDQFSPRQAYQERRVYEDFRSRFVVALVAATQDVKEGTVVEVGGLKATVKKLDVCRSSSATTTKRFKFDAADTKLKELREKYKLDDVVASGKTSSTSRSSSSTGPISSSEVRTAHREPEGRPRDS